MVQLKVGVVVVEVKEVGVLRVFLVKMVVLVVEVNEVGILQVVVAGLVRQCVSPPCSRPPCRPGDPFS
jgi:hypothetical protein